MCKYYVRVNIHECVCVCVCIFVWGLDSRDPQSLHKDQALMECKGKGKLGDKVVRWTLCRTVYVLGFGV